MACIKLQLGHSPLLDRGLRIGVPATLSGLSRILTRLVLHVDLRPRPEEFIDDAPSPMPQSHRKVQRRVALALVSAGRGGPVGDKAPKDIEGLSIVPTTEAIGRLLPVEQQDVKRCLVVRGPRVHESGLRAGQGREERLGTGYWAPESFKGKEGKKGGEEDRKTGRGGAGKHRCIRRG